MPISVTYTFANLTTADATQVNQNFTDIINALTDGTKNISISALTAAGASNLQGAVTLGASTSNLIVFNGSMNSDLPINTNTTYNIGAANKGVLSVYVGGTSTFTTRILGGTQTGNLTFVLPVSAGASQSVLTTNGSGTTSWSAPVTATNYSGFMTGATWSTTSATLADATAAGTNVLTKRFGTGLSVAAAASNGLGVTFTPSASTSVYFISVGITVFNDTAGGNNAALSLTDGTLQITTAVTQSYAISNGVFYVTLTGIYAPGTGSAVTLKIQLAAGGGGTTNAGFSGNGSKAVEWTILQLL